MRLVLLGAPGSGKGTQGPILAKHYGVTHVASGDLLRKHVAEQSEIGKQISAYLDRGELVPDDLIVAIVTEVVVEAVKRGGYVLDGFPRTIEQAERAYDYAKANDMDADAAVYLDIPDDVARERLSEREEGRTDDADDAVISHRLSVFHEQTTPLLDFYAKRGILHTVDATQGVEEVTRAILEELR
jgi:adenylate kinase